MTETTIADSRIHLGTDAASVNERVGEILRHAADKQAEVTDLAERIGVDDDVDVLIGMGSAALWSQVELTNSLEAQRRKLSLRILEADTVVSSGLEVRVVDLEDGDTIAEGILVAADYEAGTLNVVDDQGVDCEVDYVDYVTNVNAEESPDHTFSGRRLSVGIEVKSVPTDRSWVLS